MPFKRSKELDMLLRDLIVYFSKAFTSSSIKKAKKILNKHSAQVSVKEQVNLAFFTGCNFMCIIALFYLTFATDTDVAW